MSRRRSQHLLTGRRIALRASQPGRQRRRIGRSLLHKRPSCPGAGRARSRLLQATGRLPQVPAASSPGPRRAGPGRHGTWSSWVDQPYGQCAQQPNHGLANNATRLPVLSPLVRCQPWGTCSEIRCQFLSSIMAAPEILSPGRAPEARGWSHLASRVRPLCPIASG